MSVANKLDLYDFELEIGVGAGRDYPMAVLRSPAGEIRQIFHFPYDELVLENRLKSLEIALLRSGGKHRRILSPEEETVQKFGQDLFDALFSGESRSLYDLSCEKARREGKGLRLKLRIQSPELASLPWEYMYDSRQAEYVCLSRETPVIRYIELPQAIPPYKIQPPLRILGMVAGPSELPWLDIENEKLQVEKALEKLQETGLVELSWLEGQTWRDLQRAMRSGTWNVFHFIGHGKFDKNLDQGIIALADQSQQLRPLLAIDLSRLLADHRSLRMVILNSCEGGRGSQRDIFSSTASILIRRGIPAVLAMQYAITDRAAIEFSSAFYEALADGFPVDMAVCEARKAVSVAVNNSVEWGMPVLYMRSPDGHLFDIVSDRETQPSVQQPDRQAESKLLEDKYTQAMISFANEAWVQAHEKLTEIVRIQPDYKDVQQVLEFTNKKIHFQQQLIAANQKLLSGDWLQVVETLEPLAALEPENIEVTRMLGEARHWIMLSGLYNSGSIKRDAGQLHEALEYFKEIESQQPGYRDTTEQIKQLTDLISLADQKMRVEKKLVDAQGYLRSGDWQQVVNILQPIARQDPQNKEAARMLNEATAWLKKAELYEAGKARYNARNWKAALRYFTQLQEMHSGYRDTAEYITSCQKEITEADRRLIFEQKLADARLAMDARDWKKAASLLHTLNEMAPGNPEISRMLSEVNQSLQLDELYNTAVAVYKEALNYRDRVGNERLALDGFRRSLEKFCAVDIRHAGYRNAPEYIRKIEAAIAELNQDTKASTPITRKEVRSYKRQMLWVFAIYGAGIVTFMLGFSVDFAGVIGGICWLIGLSLNLYYLSQVRKYKAESGVSPDGSGWLWFLLIAGGILPAIWVIIASS